jgi:predicted phage-related endonuclease
MIANLDREVVGEKAILECKTTSAYNLKEWEDEEIPANYIIQVQHYMAVTGMRKAYIAVLIGGQKFIWKEINRDETLIDILIQEESRFWNNHILKNIPPPIDGSSAACRFLQERYPSSIENKNIELSSDNEERALRIKELNQIIKPLEDEKSSLENAIKLEMEDAEEGYINNKYLIKYKTIISNRVDSKKLKKEYPDIYRAVINESVSRRFEIKDI